MRLAVLISVPAAAIHLSRRGVLSLDNGTAPPANTTDKDYNNVPANPAQFPDIRTANGTSNVRCSPEVLPWIKESFSHLFGCHHEDGESMCHTYENGGCDNEACWDHCNALYDRNPDFKKCWCNDWSNNTSSNNTPTFSDAVPKQTCPLRLAPRCVGGTLYMTECHALQSQNGTNVSADDLHPRSEAEWNQALGNYSSGNATRTPTSIRNAATCITTGTSTTTPL